jgi:hypothetical protein
MQPTAAGGDEMDVPAPLQGQAGHSGGAGSGGEGTAGAATAGEGAAGASGTGMAGSSTRHCLRRRGWSFILHMRRRDDHGELRVPGSRSDRALRGNLSQYSMSSGLEGRHGGAGVCSLAAVGCGASKSPRPEGESPLRRSQLTAALIRAGGLGHGYADLRTCFVRTRPRLERRSATNATSDPANTDAFHSALTLSASAALVCPAQTIRTP